MGPTYAYAYKNENELKDFIQTHYHEFSNSLLIQADVANWSIGEINRLRRLISTLLPHAVMIGHNAAGHLADGRNGQSILYFTHFNEIKITSSLLDLAGNDPIIDFVKGLAFGRPKAAIMVANEWSGMLKDCIGLFGDYHPQIAIAGGTAGKNTIIFTESMISEQGIAAVTFSAQNLGAEIILNERQAEQKGTAARFHDPLKKGEPDKVAIQNHTIFGFTSRLDELPDFHAANISLFVCRQTIVKPPGKPASMDQHKDIYLCISELAGGRKDQFQNKQNHFERWTQLLQTEPKKLKGDLDLRSISGGYYDSIIKNHPDIIFTTDVNGNIRMVNPAFTKMFGKRTEELEGICWMEFINPINREQLKNGFEKAIMGKTVQLEMEVPGKKEFKTFYIHIFPIFAHEECVEMLLVGRDMTEQRLMEEKLEKMAYYDEKTGLPNQRKLEQMVNKWIQKAKKEKRSFSILFIEIDRVKTINDAFGHHVGDKARIQLAARIQSMLPGGSFLGRFSTNKFTVLLGGNTHSNAVLAICQRIVQAIQEPLLFENQEFYIAPSIGISVYPFDGQEYASLMKNADAALSRTKSGTSKNVVFYLNEMNKEMIERVELERSLRKAIDKDEFFLAYQPIINSVTKEIVACEALLRWEHPKWGIVPPMKFIPVAEETGMIHALGKWILKTACLQIKEWQRNGFENISVSVNVSAYQLQNNRFIDNIKQALDASGLAPRHLHLELTESVMIDRSLKTVDMLRELMEMGVHISIDDFGTGYSSLSYLKHFPIHTLKIDRSFIQNLHKQSPDLAIVHAILTMGHGLGLRIIAEGIETTEQLYMLTSLGCEFVQGYLIEKPMEARRFTHWLERKRQNLNI